MHLGHCHFIPPELLSISDIKDSVILMSLSCVVLFPIIIFLHYLWNFIIVLLLFLAKKVENIYLLYFLSVIFLWKWYTVMFGGRLQFHQIKIIVILFSFLMIFFRFIWIFSINQKSEVASIFKQFITMIEKQIGHKN